MTKKRFEAIAHVIKTQPIKDPRYHIENYYSLAVSLCDYFDTVNPLFDRDRFLEACGYADYGNPKQS